MKKIAAILLCLVSNWAFSQTYPILWADLQNVTVNGNNSLTRTGSAGWTAAATSLNRLDPSVDGSLQFTVTSLTNLFMVGISGYNGEAIHSSINYAFYLNNASLTMRENGATVGSGTTVALNDVLKIAREGTSVKYYKNGVVLFTSTTVATKPLRVDIAINSGSAPVMTTSFDKQLLVKPTFTFPTSTNNNGGISLAVSGGYTPIAYSWSSSETTAAITGKARGLYTATTTDANSRVAVKPYNLGYPLGWVDRLNVTVNGDNSLTKSTGTLVYDVGASSSNMLAASTDGWIEFVVNSSGSNFVLGLSRVDWRKSNNNDINYGFLFLANGNIQIIESGTTVVGYTGYHAEGYIYRITRESNSIKYYINGVAVRTVASVTNPLLVDASIGFGSVPQVNASFDRKITVRPVITYPAEVANTGGGITLNTDGGNSPYTYAWSSSETTESISNKARGSYSVTITDSYGRTFAGSYYLGYAIKWTDLRNSQLNADNSITKITTSGWDGSGLSGNQLAASTDGWLEFIVTNPEITTMFGLGQFNVSAGNTFDYSFYILNGAISSRLAGASDLAHGYVVKGDVYRVERLAGQLRFIRNGTLLRSVASTPNALYVDFSMSTMNMTSPAGVCTSFAQKPQQTFYSIVDGNWNVPATWSLSEGGAAATIFPMPNDIVYVKGKLISVVTKVTCSEVNVVVNSTPTKLNISGASSSLTVFGPVKVSGLGNVNPSQAVIVQNSGKLASM